MNFTEAMALMLNNKAWVKRKSWNNSMSFNKYYQEFIYKDDSCKIELKDVLANDWEIEQLLKEIDL